MSALGTCAILIAEDKETDVILLRRALAKAAIANPVHFVTDGEQAIAYVTGGGEFADRRRFPLPGIIVLDLKLPRQSGLEVLRWLKTQPGLRRIPVIVLTSSAEETDVNAAYDLGANSYLVKPVSFNDLLRLVVAVNDFWMLANQRPAMADLDC